MSKLKILWWGDSPTVSTGFGIVSKNLCAGIADKYNLGILGINEYGLQKYDTSKYFIYPCDRGDIMGIQRFPYIVENFKPDVIFLFQDIWNIFSLKMRHQEIFKKIPHLVYFPVDARPFSRAWKDVLLSSSKIITYTEWARKTIESNIPELANVDIEILPHGIDTSIFYPYSEQAIQDYRTKFGWNNKFVITNVNRFQPRKLINLTVRIASLFIKGYKKCKCGNIYPLHFSSCDLNECDSKSVVSMSSGYSNVILYLHMNTREQMMGYMPSDYLTSHLMNYGFTNKDINKSVFILDRNSTIYGKNEPTVKDLNNIYNASNVLLSTSLGEGFGFSTAESLATGTHVIVGNHTANFELTASGKYGTLVKNSGMFNWGGDSGHTRPIMDTEKALKAIQDEYEKFVKAGYKKMVNMDYVEHIKTNYSWSDKIAKLTDMIDTVAVTSIQDIPVPEEKDS